MSRYGRRMQLAALVTRNAGEDGRERADSIRAIVRADGDGDDGRFLDQEIEGDSVRKVSIAITTYRIFPRTVVTTSSSSAKAGTRAETPRRFNSTAVTVLIMSPFRVHLTVL